MVCLYLRSRFLVSAVVKPVGFREKQVRVIWFIYCAQIVWSVVTVNLRFGVKTLQFVFSRNKHRNLCPSVVSGCCWIYLQKQTKTSGYCCINYLHNSVRVCAPLFVWLGGQPTQGFHTASPPPGRWITASILGLLSLPANGKTTALDSATTCWLHSRGRFEEVDLTLELRSCLCVFSLQCDGTECLPSPVVSGRRP